MAGSEIKMKMSLDSSGVKAGTDKAKKSVSSFTKVGTEKIGKFASFTKTALLGAFTVAAKSALSYGKEVANLSNISNASVEEFQRMAAGAKTVGIENEKLADIFKDVNDKVGDFVQTGGGPMLDFFENIAPQVGVTADQFKNLSGPQALQLYYDSLKKANLSQQDMTFYMEAVASDATALIPLLANGGQKFKELGDAAAEAGRIMDDATAKSLKNAETALDNFSIKVKIFAGESLMGFQLIGAGIAQGAKDWRNGLGSMSKIAKGFHTGNFKLIQDGAGQFADYTNGMDKATDEAFDKMHGYAKEYHGSMGKVVSDLTSGWIKGVEAQTESQRKAIKESETRLKKFASIQEKIQDERTKRSIKEMSTSQKLNAVVEDRTMLEKELKQLDPFSEKASLKELEIEKLLTKEQQLQTQVNEETVDNKTKLLEMEVALAEASQDPARIKVAREELSRRQEILALVEKHKITDGEAAVLVDKKNAKLKEREALEKGLLALEGQLLNAQAEGNDHLATELQKRIDKENEALDIMNKFGGSIDDARKKAEKLAALRAGPDLDQSGFVTKREQREFDRQQKIKNKDRKLREHAEKMKEMREGGGIRNASDDWKEERKQILAERSAKKIQKEQEKAIKQRDIEEKKDPAKKRAREIGELAAKVMKDAKNAVKKAAEDQKKIDQNPVVKGLKPLLKSQVDLLGDIKKALQC